jgi:hypothetical protein
VPQSDLLPDKDREGCVAPDPDLRIVLAQTNGALISIERCLIALMGLVPNAQEDTSFVESIVDLSRRVEVLNEILAALPP